MTIQHPTEGVLQAYLDGEVLSEPREALDRHLTACEECRGQLADLDDLASRAREALAGIDLSTPALAEALWEVRRARAARRAHVHRRGRVAVAASAVLVAGAGLAAMAPGSPLRRLWEPAETLPVAVATSEQALELAAVSEPRGVGVPPQDGAVSVIFEGVPAGSSVEIHIVDEERATVVAPEASRFEAGEGSARIAVSGPEAELRVELPRALASAEILVNGEVVYRSVGGDASYPGPAPAPAPNGGVRLLVGAP